MPNTKSAERRMRSSARKHQHNLMIRSRLRSLEKKFLTLVNTGKKDEAGAMLPKLTSALDKAAKVGVLHKSARCRKKSRLTIRLNKASASAPAA
jgi:small subunit ribosomal protein S20